jgi:hypothetical protein
MKKSFCVVFPLVIVGTGLIAVASNPHHPSKEILHYFAQGKMANAGIVTNASGQVSLHENSVSKGKPQELRIDLRQLDTNSTYTLAALLDDDTNLTQAAQFTTDARGNAHLDYRDRNNNHGNGNGHGPGNSVPAQLSPPSNIRQLVIQDTNAQAILTADLTSPDQFVFFLKRDASANGIPASLQVNAGTHSARLRLDASALTASTDYSLALNDVVVTTASSDARGRLHAGWAFENSSDALSVHSVSLLDSSSNAVLSATLP